MRDRALGIILLVFVASVCLGIVGGFADGTYVAVLFSLFAVFSALMLLAATDGDEDGRLQAAARERMKQEGGESRAHPA